MLRDVFYLGKKPNIHPRERFAYSLKHAREMCTTEHFWIINEFCDYKNFDWDFDFDFLPDEDVWTQDHNNIWPSQHQKDSGTWLCSKKDSDVNIYRADVSILHRKNQIHDAWVVKHEIDEKTFDFSWHPDPTDPPYIYVFGNTQYPGTVMPTLEYHVSDATEYKFIEDVTPKLAQKPELFILEDEVEDFDFSWRPDPTSPPYIYAWGTERYSPTVFPVVKFKVEGATEYKFISDVQVKLKQRPEKFETLYPVRSFDYSWRPDPTDPPYIYIWGNQWFPANKMPTVKYEIEGATEIKYMDDQVAKLKEHPTKFSVIEDIEDFDFSWIPDPNDPPYIYVFGNQWHDAIKMPTVRYHVDGATEIKYVTDIVAKLLPKPMMFTIHHPVEDFDFSWRPDPNDPPYIYVFGNTQYPGQVMPTIEYKVDGATEKKFVTDIVPRLAQQPDRFTVLEPIESFDYSWVPDPTSPPYIYVWGNQWNNPEKKASVIYHATNATEKKYMDKRVVRKMDMLNWHIPVAVDPDTFDFSWEPDPTSPPYIYEFGTQWQKTGGPIYTVPGATEKKYEDCQKCKVKVSNFPCWEFDRPIDFGSFDFSWHPDSTEEPFIYQFGTQWQKTGGPRFVVKGARTIKYMDIQQATALPLKEKNWNIPVDLLQDKFDFSWHPDSTEQPYIYAWGTKFVPSTIEPAVTYSIEGATEIKHMGNDAVLAPQLDRWQIKEDIDETSFDLAWRPDPTSPPYIYVWGNKHVSAELAPTLEYRVPGATEKKYMDELIEVLPQFDRWKEIQSIDKNKFDFTWRPDPTSPPYIYVWGNKWIPGHLKSTLEYHVQGATEKKYMGDVEVLPETEKWKTTQEVSDFDFTWRPDPREPAYIYVWGNKWITGELKPTIEYYCQGATEKKYMKDVEVLPEWGKYRTLIPVDKNSFDFTWRPDPREPAYIYVWGNQINGPEIEPTIEYHCDGATERKYMHDRVATTLPDIENFKVLIPVDEFDFTWRPDPTSPPYIYIFGNQWYDAMTEPTIEYHVPGATEKKYVTDVIAKVSATDEHWKVLLPVENFDFSWRPNPHSSPYIYIFGNQWNPIELEHTVEYHVPGATDKKYITDIIAYLKPTNTDIKWKQLIPVEYFDYSWRPDPREPALIYVFGNKWNDSKTEPSIEYHCENATERKYLDYPVATPQSEMQYWSISSNNDLKTFDFSWRPNPHSPPQIYQWPNNGPRYSVPGATEIVLMDQDVAVVEQKIVPKYYIKTTLEDLIEEHKDEVFWALNSDLNYDKFDFSWTPDNEIFRHINVFGTKFGKDSQTYYINGPTYSMGYKEYNYVEDTIIEGETNISMFYIDRGNPESQLRYERLSMRYPKLQKTRYLNSWVDTINRCCKKSETKLLWILNSELVYDDFEFDFYPTTWQEKMIHVFGTQWSHWGNTYLINKEKFPEDTKYVKIIEHLASLNFVKTKKAKAVNVLYDVIYIDHGDMSEHDKENKTIFKYEDSYLNTFKNILKTLPEKPEHYIWIVSSICHYDNFDFSYICDPFAKDQLHVFPSNRQKFGDTFFVDVNKLRNTLPALDRLEDFEKVNYNNHQTVKRKSCPVVIIEDDTFSAIKDIEFDFPYIHAIVDDNKNLDNVSNEVPLSLWSPDHKNIIIHSTGGTKLTIPSEVKEYVDRELYDYPYINRQETLQKSRPLDIVFLSNGEVGADENYEHLLDITDGLPNRVVRVDGVNGRAAAYHAAANASETPWMFTVFAKLRVNPRFDWSWQPDRLQVPKHYIFTATNPLNNLEYGHQAMIAYNKKIVLSNPGRGLDFTLDDEHEVVDINSGVAMFNTDEWSTWRTSFREAIKLKHISNRDSLERLDTWLNKAEGKFGQYCLDGARHAIEYYDEVEGDIEKLRLSYEWSWLLNRFKNLYKIYETP